jgi:flagellar biosynthesis protein FlhB
MAGDKTERPTPRRRQKAREKGQVARSRELAGSLSALAAIVLLAWLLPGWGGAWRAMLREQMERAVLGEMGLGDPVILSGGLRWLSLAAGIMASAGWLRCSVRWPRAAWWWLRRRLRPRCRA